MATRSYIALLNGNDSVKAVYCHWDGYPEHNGQILAEAYNSKEKIEKLLSLGDMSILGRKIGRKHNFNSIPEDTCTFYKRDRGESDVDARVMPTSTFEHYINDSDAAYVYLFKENEWYVAKARESKLKFQKVVDVLAVSATN